MLSPVLMWNKIGRIVIKLSKRLNAFSDDYIVDEIMIELHGKYI